MEHLLKANHIPYEMKPFEMKTDADHGYHFTGLKQLNTVRRVAGVSRKYFEKTA